MRAKHWVSATIGVMALALWNIPTGATPIGLKKSLTTALPGSSMVEQTHWRGRGYGYYHGGYYPRYRYYAYYPYLPDDYYYYPRPYYYGYYSYPRYGYYYGRPYRHHYYRHW